DSVTVYQRTPNFTIPAHNGPVTEAKIERYEADPVAYREDARWSSLGVPRDVVVEGAMDVSEEERQERYEAGWESGTLAGMYGAFADLSANPVSNETLAEFVRNKIRLIVDDPATADTLCPDSYPILTKRLCLDTDYYDTFNRPHVELVDLRVDPIETITETGVDNTESGTRDFDAIVYATGFDAMTGAIVAVDIRGKDGRALADRWADGPLTYLGLTTVGYPNLFMITGPHSPSVLSNMAVSIEQHVEWVTDAIAAMHEAGYDTIEPTPTAEAGWVHHTHDFGDITLFPQANSWYMGANVEGKPKVFLPYIGGVNRYRRICDEVVERNYLGFTMRGPDGSTVNDGVICRVQPDVTLLLEAIAELPTIDSMPVDDARAFLDEFNKQRAPGPEVGELVDGTYPAAEGHELAYRLYRPATEGPHPIIVYYHGGGWVLGDAVSDDPLCRDLCVRTDSIIVSVDYRHAPEHRFPAAVDDGWAALQWVSENAESLGGLPDQLAVAGWSAGGNLAAVMTQQARDAGGPELRGQMLLTPVTDSDFERASYTDNAHGYFLTASMMHWFWDHYVDPEHRSNPRVAPLQADDLSGLPPAVIVTCEFDPLRDEGDAYAEALAAAGVPVTHVSCPGHIHTSIGAVDVLPSGAAYREEMARAIRAFFPASVRA
ncbi:MAG: alpha/beta hydrolase, partial [Acidimicrobiia bacterium]|nr:alpha/beta hydrolase [Acidimicrobiia bacterium]